VALDTNRLSDLFQGDAALALEHDLRLITRDAHFACIPQLLRG
jgi:hypothetical protein